MDSRTIFNIALAAAITSALIALPLAAVLAFRLWRALPQHRPSKTNERPVIADAVLASDHSRIRESLSTSLSPSSSSTLTNRVKAKPVSSPAKATPSTSGSSATQCTATIYLGSGGHSAEMLQLVSGLDPSKYQIRHYIVGQDDDASVEKVHRLESLRGQADVSDAFKVSSNGKEGSEASKRPGGYTVNRIPRSRHVHQSFLTTPFTLAKSLLVAMTLIRRLGCSSKDYDHKDHKSVLLMNGPGTCFALALAVIGLRILGVVEDERTPDLVFVESFARVRTLSMTGKLVYPLCDAFLVQWPGLREQYPRAQYIGALV
ncbi:UDP-N-acetylglucosamine transferase subunit [Gryganskiella cystojenkinii]|nr:UDP-N-acetylglucosamine transferase subunit [Gryganskiella cystojenkinii]